VIIFWSLKNIVLTALKVDGKQEIPILVFSDIRVIVVLLLVDLGGAVIHVLPPNLTLGVELLGVQLGEFDVVVDVAALVFVFGEHEQDDVGDLGPGSDAGLEGLERADEVFVDGDRNQVGFPDDDALQQMHLEFEFADRDVSRLLGRQEVHGIELLDHVHEQDDETLPVDVCQILLLLAHQLHELHEVEEGAFTHFDA